MHHCMSRSRGTSRVAPLHEGEGRLWFRVMNEPQPFEFDQDPLAQVFPLAARALLRVLVSIERAHDDSTLRLTEADGIAQPRFLSVRVPQARDLSWQTAARYQAAVSLRVARVGRLVALSRRKRGFCKERSIRDR